MLKIHYLKLIIICLLVLFPLLSSATSHCPGYNFEFGYISLLLCQIGDLIDLATPVVFALALVFFLWGMAIFILNAGNEEKRSEGKKRMIWGLIILSVMVAFWGIIELFQLTFGTSGIEPLPSQGFPQIPSL